MRLRLILIVFFSIALFVNSKFGTVELGVGEKGKDFSLKNVDGKMVSLTDMKDAKGYIVIFTCNHCPYAKAYEDRIIALHEKYAPKGYPVVAINPNDAEVQPQDSFDEMKKRAESKNFPFPYVQDETQEIARFYGATRTPHVYVMDKSLTVKYVGAIDNNYKSAKDASERYVEDAVDALLKGEEVKTNYTKAIGCGIKWSKS